MFLPRAAFVVEVDDGDSSRLRGQVEHVLSGESSRFDSDAALLRFIRRALAVPEQTDPSDTGGKG
jgi:hypothetical protein